MASGYVTSEGNDLDQRYLAIGGKAESAKVADKVSSSIAIRRAGNTVYAKVDLAKSATHNYTCPCSGILGMSLEWYVDVNFGGNQHIDVGNTLGFVNYKCFYVNKGDVIPIINTSGGRRSAFLHITPVTG